MHKVSMQREMITDCDITPGDMLVGGAAVPEIGKAEMMDIHM